MIYRMFGLVQPWRLSDAALATVLFLLILAQPACGDYLPSGSAIEPWYVSRSAWTSEPIRAAQWQPTLADQLAEMAMLEPLATETSIDELLVSEPEPTDTLSGSQASGLMKLTLPIATTSPEASPWNNATYVSFANHNNSPWQAWRGLSKTSAWDNADGAAWYVGGSSRIGGSDSATADVSWLPLPVAGLLVGVTFLGRHLLHKHSLATSTS